MPPHSNQLFKSVLTITEHILHHCIPERAIIISLGLAYEIKNLYPKPVHWMTGTLLYACYTGIPICNWYAWIYYSLSILFVFYMCEINENTTTTTTTPHCRRHTTRAIHRQIVQSITESDRPSPTQLAPPATTKLDSSVVSAVWGGRNGCHRQRRRHAGPWRCACCAFSTDH